MWEFEPTTPDILKTACMFEIFGLPDCAAELIVKYRERIGDESELTPLLDLLAADQAGERATYAGLLQEFSAEVRRRRRRTRSLGPA
jgi:hypothetical protein